MLKKLETRTIISCGQREKTIKECENCVFFNGIIRRENSEDIEGVDCLKKEIPVLNNIHITEFTKGGQLYSARYYDEEIDGPLNEDYDYCKKCCFNRELQNGEEICLLRYGVPDDAPNTLSMFCCYDEEIWEKKNIEET